MPTLTTATTPSGTEAVDEAIRTITETSRRGTEGAKSAVQVARGYLEQIGDYNRKLIGVWASGIEASLKANFEIQNAMTASNLSLLDTINGSNKSAVAGWIEVQRQSQQMMLDGLHGSLKALDKLPLQTKPAQK